ncbi:hypothetical protein [Streptomyces sp. NPDC001401]|uniref:hypothetical protein n=1 Tax=Streptomyces sp. NPDC001401 TaxID=3364570 RepID=UPI0036B5913B
MSLDHPDLAGEREHALAAHSWCGWTDNTRSAGFPQEMERFPGRIRVVTRKTVTVAAGLGEMGLHRNGIHPTFGNFVRYVLPGSNAPQYAELRFPHKPVKEITGGRQPPSKRRPTAP